MGAYSSLAAMESLGEGIDLIGVESFKAVVDSVKAKKGTIGILPIQNSTSGSIRETYDLLRENELKIIKEVIIPIKHAWMTLEETDPNTIVEVLSHPEALYQCQDFIETKGLKAVQSQDTASCAKTLSELKQPGISVIAHENVAKLYGLKVLATDVQTEDLNQTRFIVFGSEPGVVDGTKASVYIEIENQRGALYQVISQLVSREVNIISIDSRPIRSRSFDIGFFLDIEMKDATDLPAIERALDPHTMHYTLLGQYEPFSLGA
jgi:prephenate dehydratase